jgi:long-chain fatty acid transport protein
MRNRITIPFAALAVLAVVGLASEASASGFYVGEQDSVASSRGLAVTAKLMEPSTLYFNPAGIAFLEGVNVSAGFTAIIPTFKYSDPDGLRKSADSKSNIIWDPHLYATYSFGKKAAIGVGFNAPFGLVLEWPKAWAGQQQIQKIDLKIPTIYIGAAARPIPRLSIGVTLRVMPATVSLQRGFALTDSSGNPAQGGIELSASAIGFGASLGIMARPADWLHLGFSYMSQANFEFSNGEGKFTLPAGFDNTLFHDQKGTTRITTPDILSFGIGFDVHPDVTLELDYNLTLWQTYDELTIHFNNDPSGQLSKPSKKNWKNTSCVRLGMEYKWKDTFKLRAGLIWDQSPAPNATLGPELPDADRLVWTIGLGYEYHPLGIKIDAYYLMTNFLERTVRADVNPTFPATYKGMAHLVGVTLGYGTPGRHEPPAAPDVEPPPPPSPASGT